MRYFDAHAHIQFPQYDLDREEVLAGMRSEDIGALIVGVDEASSRNAVALVENHENLWASIGLHPNAAHEWKGVDAYRELAKHEKVVAIGECGLDNFRPEDPSLTKATQREVFEAHVALAGETGKPLMIHARPSKGTADAYEDVIDILTSAKREYGDAFRGDMHFFVGGIEEARKLVELDFTLSYTAVLTFARDYDDVVRFIPSTHILSETDSPYVAPAPNRGRRNDPRAVVKVVEAIGEIRGEEAEAVRAQILGNARKLFRLS